MPIAITGYNGSPNNFSLKVDYTEPAGVASVNFELWDAQTNLKLSSLGSVAGGGNTKTYPTVVVGAGVNEIKVRAVAVDAAGNIGPESFSAPEVIDRTPPGPVVL